MEYSRPAGLFVVMIGLNDRVCNGTQASGLFGCTNEITGLNCYTVKTLTGNLDGLQFYAGDSISCLRIHLQA